MKGKIKYMSLPPELVPPMWKPDTGETNPDRENIDSEKPVPDKPKASEVIQMPKIREEARVIKNFCVESLPENLRKEARKLMQTLCFNMEIEFMDDAQFYGGFDSEYPGKISRNIVSLDLVLSDSIEFLKTYPVCKIKATSSGNAFLEIVIDCERQGMILNKFQTEIKFKGEHYIVRTNSNKEMHSTLVILPKSGKE
jgi:hypothetical protein